MKLTLVIAEGQPQQRELPVRLNQFLIGRDPECHLRPASPLVSKRHCALLIREGKVFLRDFDSTNGTEVNDRPLKGETQLQEGDRFKVGPIEFRVRMEPTGVISLPTKPAAKPTAAKPTPVAARDDDDPPRGRIDEDAVADLLFSLAGDDAAKGNIEIPGGSTVMEMVPLSDGSAVPEEKKDDSGEGKKSTSKKLVIDPKATSDAAKAILDKYMRRPRG